MKKIVVAFFLTCIITTSFAQETDPWTKYMTPNEIHQMLAEYEGDFNVEISMWMMEGTAPTLFNVSSKNQMHLGNRFLEMTQSGKMMNMEYQSVSTIGYNTISKLFSQYTITNMGTGSLYLEGLWDAKKRIANLKGKMTNPMDNKPIAIRQQISFIDKNHLLIENFDTYEGGVEKKTVQYAFSRKQTPEI
jgi:Protein of unknown function (DUF1579)